MNSGRVLIAGGLTVWLGLLVAAVYFVQWRMRSPKSLFTSHPLASPGSRAVVALVGLGFFASYAFANPSVALVADVFLSGLIAYVLAAYAVALTVERGRAKRLGLPEPGTGGTVSAAESAGFLAVALPLAVAGLGMTAYGMVNELVGNGSEGLAGLGLGAFALVLAIVMGIFASPLLLVRRRR
jgi:hypothetical protein